MNADALDIRLLRFRSKRDESPLDLGKALLDAKRVSEALEVAHAGLLDTEDDPDLLVLEGRAWFQEGDLPQAQAALLRAAKRQPTHVEAYRWLSQVLMKRGEPGKAVKVLERAVQLRPADDDLQKALQRATRLSHIAEQADSGNLPAPLPNPHPAHPAPAMSTRHTRSTLAVDDPLAPLAEAPISSVEVPVPDSEPAVRDLQGDALMAAFTDLPSEDGVPVAEPRPAYDLTSQESGLELLDDDDGATPFRAESSFSPTEAVLAREQETAPAGEAETPEQVLEVVKEQGLFEQPGAPQQPDPTWVGQREAVPEGTRTRGGLALGWGLAVVLAGGGYYGWTKWVEHRHEQAAMLVSEAVRGIAEGDYTARAQAEAELGQARELDPSSPEADRAAVLLHSTRALEDGELDVSYLRNALARLGEISKKSPVETLASGIVQFSSQNIAAAKSALASVDASTADPSALYLAASLAWRMGDPNGAALLERAAEAKQAPVAVVYLRLAAAFSAGAEAAALGWVEAARGADDQGLRAELWQELLLARAQPGPDSFTRLDKLAAKADEAALTDRVLLGLARARLHASLDELPAARQTLQSLSALGVRDPELLAQIARVASEVGEHDVAYAAARGALQTAPENPRYRDEMVRALLGRGDGEAVEHALQNAPGEARWAAVARARAALMTGDPESLARAAKQLAKLDDGGTDVERDALAARLDLKLGQPARQVLVAVRKLARLEPGDATVLLALGEAALATGDAKTAAEALEKALATDLSNGELLFLLARAYRETGDLQRSEQALQQALVAAPGLAGASQEMAQLQLERGDFAEAEERFAALDKADPSVAAKLGRAAALIGLGRLLDAREVLRGVPAEQAQTPQVVLVDARLQLALGNPAAAQKRLEPLLKGDTRGPELLSAYGDALFAADKVDSAAGAYDDALELDAQLPEALVGRAAAAVRAEKTKQAYDWLDRAEKSLQKRARPPALRARLLVTRGKAYIHDREFARARAALEEASKLRGAPAETFFWYAESLALTKTPGAPESYERYLELAPHGDLAGRATRALKPR